MITAHFYDLSTGLISPSPLLITSEYPERFIEANTPKGCGVRLDVSDALSQRVDQKTNDLVDYQPPRPDDDHEWDVATKRWVKRSDVTEWEEMRMEAQRRIDSLELKTLRPLRERDDESESEEVRSAARARLSDIRAQIEPLRAIVNEPKPQSRR